MSYNIGSCLFYLYWGIFRLLMSEDTQTKETGKQVQKGNLDKFNLQFIFVSAGTSTTSLA